jgi:hypothetical protein
MVIQPDPILDILSMNGKIGHRIRIDKRLILLSKVNIKGPIMKFDNLVRI